MGVSYKGFGRERVNRPSVPFSPPDGAGDEKIWNDWSVIRFGEDRTRIVEEARGWPLKCLVWYLAIETGEFRGGLKWGDEISGEYVINKAGDRSFRTFDLVPKHPFPYLPHWRGLIINWVFYLCLIVCVIYGASAARVVSRKRSGRCVNCGYSLKGNVTGVCSECGMSRE